MTGTHQAVFGALCQVAKKDISSLEKLRRKLKDKGQAFDPEHPGTLAIISRARTYLHTASDYARTDQDRERLIGLVDRLAATLKPEKPVPYPCPACGEEFVTAQELARWRSLETPINTVLPQEEPQDKGGDSRTV